MSNNVSIITVIIGNNQQFQEYSDFKSAMVSLQSLCHGPAEVWGLFWNTILVFFDFDFKFELFYHELQGFEHDIFFLRQNALLLRKGKYPT